MCHAFSRLVIWWVDSMGLSIKPRRAEEDLDQLHLTSKQLRVFENSTPVMK